MKIQINKKKITKKLEYIISIVIVLLVFGLGLILNSKKDSSGNIPLSYSNLSSSPKKLPDLLPVNDLINIKLENKNLKLTGDWHINSIIRGFSQNNLNCINSKVDTCLVYQISNGKEIFYISNQSAVLSNDTSVITKEINKINTFHNKIEFTYEKLNLQKKGYSSSLTTTNLNIKIYKQIYGEITDGIFISSGLFPFNEAANKIVLTDFENFVQSLKM